MTDKKSFADKVRGHATDDPPAARRAPEPSLDRCDDALFARLGRASDADPETGFCPRVYAREEDE